MLVNFLKKVKLIGTATVGNVLKGKSFYNTDEKVLLTGTMPDNGAVSKSITPSTSSQSYTIPAGYHNGSGKVTVSAIPAKSIVSGYLYLPNVGDDYAAGYLNVNLLTAVKPTKIGYNVTQNNADSGTWEWNFKIEGLRYGTSTWDVLVSQSVDVAGGGSKTMSGSKSVTASYYYSEFRVFVRDRGRVSGGAYIYVHGSIAW